MSGLKEKIEQDFLAALKNKEGRLSILRMLKSALQNGLIEKRTKEKRVDVELNEEDILAILRRQVKQLKETLLEFEKAGRTELIKQNKEEITVLEDYLPRGLGEEELREVVRETIKENNASGPADSGRVIGLVIKKVGGRAEGGKIREIVVKSLGE